MPASVISRRRRSRRGGPAEEIATGDRFCVQKHDARRLHYDLRLELDGVLKSWAVTRGPSLVPGEKRLAVHTEDHPLEYLTFEGVIPKGEYGGGTMIVWDRGHWKPLADPHKGYAKGHLDFELDGERLKGRWHLVRMRPRPREKKEQWLLLKGDDEYARPPGDTRNHRGGDDLGALRADERRISRRPARSRRTMPTAPESPKPRQTARRQLPACIAGAQKGPAAGLPRAEPRDARRRGARRRRVAPRDQVRRLSPAGPHRWPCDQAPDPQRPRLDGEVQADRRGASGA